MAEAIDERELVARFAFTARQLLGGVLLDEVAPLGSHRF